MLLRQRSVPDYPVREILISFYVEKKGSNPHYMIQLCSTAPKGEASMQKTFIKYTVYIITTAIFVILFVNFIFNMHLLESQQFDTFYAKTEQMIHTLENNQAELDLLRESLDEDYLTRARAAAYVLDRQEEVSMDVEQMQYLADLLNVDELHVIDENGIIVSASVSKYVNFDMGAHEQTRPFLDLIGRGDEDAYLIQEALPNAAEGKIMQYVGVARKENPGVIQVGFTPTRQLEAQSRNTYDYIFSKFPTDIGEELFVVDASTGSVLGHSDGLQQDFSADCYRLDLLSDCTKGAYQKGKENTTMYVVSRPYGDILLCAALPRNALFQKLWKNILATFFYLLFIEAVVILLLNHLVKRNVINGIHDILDNLDAITNGNLDTTVSVSGNREFEELSRSINTMVKSIVNLSDRISAIIEISGIPLAAFEYEKGIHHVFVTTGLSSLLNLPEKKAAELYHNSTLFDQYIHAITQTPIKGETEIYQISEDRYVRIHLSKSPEGYLGIITDVTGDIQQKLQLCYENSHDPLTGLYKFDYFKEMCTETLENMQPGKTAAVVMLDLDHFKSINDTYGHDAGDRYLQSFSNVMKSMPENHFLSARRSGDEFCMLIFDCSGRTEITDYLNAFYEALQRSAVALSDTQTKIISASCGFVLTDSVKSGIAELLRRADEALYRVKKGTKGKYAEYTE